MKNLTANFLLFATLALLAWARPVGAQAEEPLTLRVNDATALPGGLVAIVVRTYASRPIRQGQVCMFTALRGGTTSPFAALEDAFVYSSEQDAWQSALFDSADPAEPLLVRFASPTASINAADGPLLALIMRLRKDVVAGAEYDLRVDLANTVVLNAMGQAISVVPRDGRLLIKQAGGAFGASVDTDWLSPSVALLSLQTTEILPLSSGQIALRYPQRAFPAAPKVIVDGRYGAAALDVLWLPGLVIVNFTSPDNSLNTLPGNIVSVAVAAGRLAPQAVLPVTLDPALTFLRDQQGLIIPLAIENDELVVE